MRSHPSDALRYGAVHAYGIHFGVSFFLLNTSKGANAPDLTPQSEATSHLFLHCPS